MNLVQNKHSFEYRMFSFRLWILKHDIHRNRTLHNLFDNGEVYEVTENDDVDGAGGKDDHGEAADSIELRVSW